jgi:hypothetical protein
MGSPGTRSTASRQSRVLSSSSVTGSTGTGTSLLEYELIDLVLNLGIGGTILIQQEK